MFKLYWGEIPNFFAILFGIVKSLFYLYKNSGVEQLAHNQEVTGLSPVSATKKKKMKNILEYANGLTVLQIAGLFFLVLMGLCAPLYLVIDTWFTLIAAGLFSLSLILLAVIGNKRHKEYKKWYPLRNIIRRAYQLGGNELIKQDYPRLPKWALKKILNTNY